MTFEPIAGNESAEMRCGNVPIIDDTVAGEPDEQFSVRLISANPPGNFSNDETCVTIVDNDDGKRFYLSTVAITFSMHVPPMSKNSKVFEHGSS